jgi:hypothetical protein
MLICTICYILNSCSSLVDKGILQSLAQDKAVPDGASECGQVDDCRNTMQDTEALVQLLHCLRVRAGIRVFLAIASFWKSLVSFVIAMNIIFATCPDGDAPSWS